MQHEWKIDIREHKKNLRLSLKQKRNDMSSSEKESKSNSITTKIISTSWYKNSDTILVYVSTEIEVDTKELIKYALNNGKKVAVPRCIPGTCEMDFYYISSLDDLETGTFSVLEPVIEKCQKVEIFDNVLSIVPGLAFDLEGYRIGYGKGYYDRFLSKHRNMFNIGICFCNCIVTKLYRGRFDVSVNALITEKFIKTL